MQFPFVTRGRFEDLKNRLDAAEKRIEAIEQEKHELLDKVLILSGNKPIYNKEPEPAPVVSVGEKELEEMNRVLPMRSGRSLARDISAWASARRRPQKEA